MDRSNNNNNNDKSSGSQEDMVMHALNSNETTPDDALDHALLESLFYNEMIGMDGDAAALSLSVSDSSPFLSFLPSPPPPPPKPQLGGGGEQHLLVVPGGTPPSAAQSIPTRNNNNPTTTDENHASALLAERALLSDFGVPDSGEATGLTARVVTGLAPTATAGPAVSATTTNTATIPVPVQEVVSQERAQQLVSQFATLASRLGISLPPAVLTSLTATAAANEATHAAIHKPTLSRTSTSGGGGPSNNNTISTIANGLAGPMDASSVAVASVVPSQPIALSSKENSTPPLVQQLQTTAEAAIAAVSRKRTAEAIGNTTSTSSTAPNLSNNIHHASAAVSSKAPLYSKRRKKPRLSDCETKLAQLKEENDMLKRHLESITTRSTQLEEERKQAEREMKRRLQQGDPDTLPPLLNKFSEMYSDYGEHRHNELSFHLLQLEKLVAPTNFTKMGLWTLGQSEGFFTNPKRNPIAGILRKELNISPAQGRKIMEQRQKIRDVCANVKECLVLLGKLKALCEHKQKVFSDRMSKCQEILTPLQVVKLLLWVDEHSQVLESVCPGWGSERIQPKKPPSKPPPPPTTDPP